MISVQWCHTILWFYVNLFAARLNASREWRGLGPPQGPKAISKLGRARKSSYSLGSPGFSLTKQEAQSQTPTPQAQSGSFPPIASAAFSLALDRACLALVSTGKMELLIDTRSLTYHLVDLAVFCFMIVWKQCTFNRNYTLNFNLVPDQWYAAWSSHSARRSTSHSSRQHWDHQGKPPRLHTQHLTVQGSSARMLGRLGVLSAVKPSLSIFSLYCFTRI